LKQPETVFSVRTWWNWNRTKLSTVGSFVFISVLFHHVRRA